MAQQPKKEYLRAKRIAFQLLKFRARSEKEIIDRLKKKKICEDNINKVIDFLKRTELLNDCEFARSWVNSCISKKVGVKKIYFDLKQKGVKKEIIEEALDNIKDKYKEADVALELARKRMERLSNIDEFKAKRRIYGFLIRRGFSSDTVNEVMQEL